MSARYFPRSDAGLLVWLGNFQTALPTQAKAHGLAPSETKDALDGAKALCASIATDEQKYADWQAAVARTSVIREKTLTEIQRVIDRMKTSPSYTEESAKALQAVPVKATEQDLAAHKPVIRGSSQGGKVRIHWMRGALDGINVYSRKQGDSAWVLLGHDSRPPYDDPRPINSVEVREYRAIGVSHDQEVGQASDTIAVAVSV